MRTLPRRGREPVVFMYHGFCEQRRVDDPENLFVEVSALEEQMRCLLDRGWRPLTLQQWLDIRAARLPRPRRSFLLTIDDAFVSVADLAVPVLADLEVPCVLLVPVGLAGGTADWLPVPAHMPLLTRDRVIALEGPLVEIGLHGWDHTSMAGCGPEELVLQIERGRDVLESWLGLPPRTFSYPFGEHDADARAAVAAAGFEVAFSVFEDSDLMAVSRVDINATDTVRSFRFKTIRSYRGLWRALHRAAIVRRMVRALLTHRPRPGL